MIQKNRPSDEVLKFKSGLELLILYKSLARYKRHREDGTVGVYNDDKAESEHEIWVEKKLWDSDKREFVLTVIHEVLHFVSDAGEDLRDPDDYDAIAEYILDLAKNISTESLSTQSRKEGVKR